MNEDKNKEIVRRFIEEMWNQRKLEVADELFAVDCLTHQLRSDEDAAGDDARWTGLDVDGEGDAEWVVGVAGVGVDGGGGEAVFDVEGAYF